MLDSSVFDLVLNIIAVIHLIVAVIALCLITSVFYDDDKYPKGFHTKQHKITISLCIMCYIIFMIAVYLCTILGDSNKASFAYLTGFIIYALFSIYEAYILFILRQYTTVNTFHFFSMVNILYHTSYHIIIFIILLSNFYNDEMIAIKKENLKYIYSSIILTHVFIFKLTEISLIAHNNEQSLYNEPVLQSSDDDKICENMQMTSKADQRAKMSVLSSIMAVSSVSFIIPSLISTFYGYPWYFGVNTLIIDIIVTAFCIYLGSPYDSSKRIYQYFCKHIFVN